MTDDTELVWLVGEFVHAATWPQSRAVVVAHPELLDGRAEEILAKRAASAGQQGDHDTAARLDLHRRLLERCRQIGVDEAFDERAEASTEAPLGLEGVSLEQAEQAAQMLFGFVEGDLAEARRLATEHPEFVTDEAAAALEELAQLAGRMGNRTMAERAERRRRLVRRVQEIGLAAAFDEAAGRVGDHDDARPLASSAGAGPESEELEAGPGLGPAVPAAMPLQALLERAGQAEERARERMGDIHAARTAAAAWQALVDHPGLDDADPSFQRGTLGTAGAALLRLYFHSGDPADLEGAIGAWARLAAETPDDDPNLVGLLRNLGGLSMQAWQRTRREDHLDSAVGFYQRAVACLSASSDVELPGMLTNLGNALSDRAEQRADLADLDAAVAAYQRVVDLVPTGDPHFAGVQGNLGGSLQARYKRRHADADLDGAVAAYERALSTRDVAADDQQQARPVEWDKLLSNLAVCLSDRYDDRHDPADLDRSVAFSQQAARLVDRSSADYPGYLTNLGNHLTARYRLRRDRADLEQAIEAYQQAVDDTPAGSPDLPNRLSNLASDYLHRQEFTRDLADVDAAVNAARRAVDAGPPPDELPVCLSTLSRALRERGRRTSNLQDLSGAVEAARRAVAAAPADADRVSAWLDTLGSGLLARYELASDLADLEQAIDAYRLAADKEAASADPSDLPAALDNLGTALRDRFRRLGEPENLEEAIGAYERAVALARDGSAELPGLLINLAAGLADRFTLTGRLADLQASVERAERAGELVPADSPDRPLYLATLAGVLLRRHERLHAAADLDRAVMSAERGLATAPAGSPHLPLVLSSLGNGLLDRYQRDHNPRDLDALVDARQRVVALTAAGARELPGSLGALGVALGVRYDNRGDPADLDAAIDALRRAVVATPVESTDLPSLLNNLAAFLRNRFARGRSDEDRREAVRAYRRSCQLGLTVAPQAVLVAGAYWGLWATERAAWQEAVEAFRAALDAAEQLVKAQTAREEKESWLKATPTLAARAAYALAMTGADQEAVAALERGRAVLLTEALEHNRVELRRLGRPQLVERYQAASGHLHALERAGTGAGPGQPAGPGSAGPPATVAEWRAAHAELDAAVAAIRRVRGWEEFLAPPSFETVATAAAQEPIAYLAMTGAGGLALIVWPDRRVERIWLPELTNDGLADQIGAYLSNDSHFTPVEASAALTHWLWDAVMGPMLAACTAAASMVLVPTGLLGLFPLHAAWTSDTTTATGRRYALDGLQLTYAPNARALQEARRVAARVPPASLLAIEEPRPVQGDPLPAVVPEVAAVCAAFDPARVRRLQHEQASLDAVLGALDGAGVLHFACHAYANPEAPMDSALVLAGDTPLTLRALLAQRLEARLTVLSACETAQTGTGLPDEVVGLPAGLLQAGVGGVIASLWAVPDTATMLLMVEFYERWRRRGETAAEALRQAQQWLRDATNAELRRRFQVTLHQDGAAWPPRPVAQICLEALALRLGDPERRDFAEPESWAAFALVGA